MLALDSKTCKLLLTAVNIEQCNIIENILTLYCPSKKTADNDENLGCKVAALCLVYDMMTLRNALEPSFPPACFIV